MSDAELRTLERTLASDPHDDAALARYAAAITRVGRGWHGEPLPPGVRCSPRERNVYLWTRYGLDLEMVHVPAGPFLYGPDKREERTDAYLIGRYPVTWHEYMMFCGRRHRTPDAPRWGIQADHPVVNVSWHDAVAFCRWSGLVLPNELQFEKAARGTDGRTYPWGEAAPTPEHAVFNRPWNTGSTEPVRDADGRPARSKGMSAYGACDMSGNVWQWNRDAWEASEGADPFELSAADRGTTPGRPFAVRTATGTSPDSSTASAASASAFPSPPPPLDRTAHRDSRVLRGGSWSFGSVFLRAASRFRFVPGTHYDFFGFRVAVGAVQHPSRP